MLHRVEEVCRFKFLIGITAAYCTGEQDTTQATLTEKNRNLKNFLCKTAEEKKCRIMDTVGVDVKTIIFAVTPAVISIIVQFALPKKCKK